MHSILQILTYTSEYISETIAPMVIVPHHSLIFFYIPRVPVTETVKVSWAAQAGQQKKTGPAKWDGALVLFTGEIKTTSCSCYGTGGKSPRPLKHLELTPEEGWANSLKLAIHISDTTILNPLYSSTNSLNSTQVIFSFSVLTSSWWLPCILFYFSKASPKQLFCLTIFLLLVWNIFRFPPGGQSLLPLQPISWNPRVP